MNTLTIYFDGLCEPNPGVGCYGFSIIGHDDEELAFGSGCVGVNTTNNIAEYAALVFALNKAIDSGWIEDGVVIRGDSQLVIRQVTGEYQCNKDHLRRGRDKVRELLKNTKHYLEWIPREQNTRADELSVEAYFNRTGKYPPVRPPKRKRP